MTPAQATLQLAALNVVRAEFNDVIVPSAGRIVAAFTALASSPERTSGILAYNIVSAQFKTWGVEITAGIASTKAQIPDDTPLPIALNLPPAGFDLLVGAEISLAPFVTSSKPVVWSIAPNAVAKLSSDGKLTAIQVGNADVSISVDTQ